MSKARLVKDPDYYKEVKSDGSEYKTPEDQRKWSKSYYDRHKEMVKQKHKYRLETDEEYRTRKQKIKRKNEKVAQERNRKRREEVYPYLVKINNDLIIVGMCTVYALSRLLGLKKLTVMRYLTEGVIPKPLYKTGESCGHAYLFTEMQALYIKEVYEECRTKVGANKKVLREKTHEFWKMYPHGFDLDDLEFEPE